MLDKVKEALSNLPFLNPRDMAKIASATTLRTIDEGDYVFREGEQHYIVYVVLKGLLRSYVINQNGEEVTLRFVPEKEKAGSYNTIINDLPAAENLMALEKTVVLSIDTRKAKASDPNNSRALKAKLDVFQKLLNDAIDRLKFYTVYSPEERYEKFRNDYPDLEQRVKQKHLASYLGITPQSLSRIRARIVKR
jgi:CRP-like cAMP-binding protein